MFCSDLRQLNFKKKLNIVMNRDITAHASKQIVLHMGSHDLVRNVVIKFAFVCENNKGADQPAHVCSRISTFDILCLEGLIAV